MPEYETKTDLIDFSDFPTYYGRALMSLRLCGTYRKRSIYLDRGFEWKVVVDEKGDQCLIAKKQ